MDTKLLEAIKEIRDKNGILTDADFARTISVDPSNWHRIKTGERQPSRKILSALLTVYPELTKIIIQHISELSSEPSN